MRSRHLLLLLAVGAAGCGDDGTGNSGDGIPVSDITGTWSITLGDSLPCPDSLVDRDISVLVTGTDDEVEPGGSLTFAETWSTAGGLNGAAYGTINVLSRSVILHLTRQDSLGYAMEVRGALDDNLALHGLANDPYQGYSPLLVSAQCTFDVQGTRTSP